MFPFFCSPEANSQWVNFTTIPRDEDGTYKDKLADHWEELMLADPHCPDTVTTILQITPTQNVDRYLPGWLPLQLGDQLSTFEEYRGFYCRRVHARTKPWERDFFIYSDLDSAALNTGIGYAELIGPGLGHWIDSTEMRNYSVPDPQHPILPENRAVNWLSDRIDSTTVCPSAILLISRSTDVHPLLDTLGITFFYGDSARYYHVPQNTTLGYIFPYRIMYHTPPDTDLVTFDSLDVSWQDFVAGHEIGHMTNMPENPHDSSSIMNTIGPTNIPPDQYQIEDLDYFMIKPPAH